MNSLELYINQVLFSDEINFLLFHQHRRSFKHKSTSQDISFFFFFFAKFFFQHLILKNVALLFARNSTKQCLSISHKDLQQDICVQPG